MPLPNEVVKEHASPCQADEKDEDCAEESVLHLRVT